MARAAYLPIPADRYEACVRTIRFRGLDLRDLVMRAQIRQAPDTPGVPLVDLLTVTNGNAEGLRIVDFALDGIVPVTTVELVINETTMEALPYVGELGDATVLAYDLQGVFAGRKRKLLRGEFIVLPGVTGADNAPTNWSSGFGGAGNYSTWTSREVSFSDDAAQVSLDGIDLLDPFYGAMIARTEAERATQIARAVLYGVADPAQARLFTADSVELAFAEPAYRDRFRGVGSAAAIAGWAFSRAGTATAPTTSGRVAAFAPDTPGITDRGLLIEASSTNRVTQSNDFTQAAWSKTEVTLAPGRDGPLGAGTATRVTPINAGLHAIAQQMDNVSAASCYVKGDGLRIVAIQIQTSASTKTAYFDLISGVVADAAGIGAYIEPASDGFWRITAVIPLATATVLILPATDALGLEFAANGVAGFVMSGVQVESRGLPTSYIPTTTGPAIRGDGLASIDYQPAGNFTLFAEAELSAVNGEDNTILSIVNSAEDRITLLRTAAGLLAVEVKIGATIKKATGSPFTRGVLRTAVSVTGTGVQATFDDKTSVAMTVATPLGLSKVWLGIVGSTIEALNGTIRSVVVRDRVSNTGELERMMSLSESLPLEGDFSEAMRQVLQMHANDTQPHDLASTNRQLALADSKTGIWTLVAADTFAGPDGSPLGNAEFGGQPWLCPADYIPQRIGGRAKEPGGRFTRTMLDLGYVDGQIEADLFPPIGGPGEASLYFRISASSGTGFLVQRGGDGTAGLFANTGGADAGIIAPQTSIPFLGPERWKARFIGPRIWVFQIVGGIERLIFDVTDSRMGTQTRHGFRLNGAGTIDNFRALRREAL